VRRGGEGAATKAEFAVYGGVDGEGSVGVEGAGAGGVSECETLKRWGWKVKRAQLEHVLRACAAITGTTRFVVVGSQSILGQYPEAPADLLTSSEVDIYAPESSAASELIDGTIGEGSPFHTTFGYHARGVGRETAALPAGWEGRVIVVSTPATGGATGLCLEANDVAVSKLVAGREKDLVFVGHLIQHGLAEAETIRQRLVNTPMVDELRGATGARLLKSLELAGARW